MKRLYYTLFVALLFSVNLVAAPVGRERAMSVGQSFLSKPVSATGKLRAANTKPDLVLVYSAEPIGSTAGSGPAKNRSQAIVPFYVFATGSSYVIVAGDDRAIPILGYSESGTFYPDSIPGNMQKWLEGYRAEMRYAIENGIAASPETVAEWEALSQGGRQFVPSAMQAVAPLCAAKWNQAPYYNALCPYNNSYGERTVSGCVATAMAIVMKYWNYPTTGTGFHSYNHSTYGTLSANFGSTTYQWSAMPNSVNSANNAVATLMYHCGVSVDMDYGVSSTGGSSAYMITAASPVQHCTEYALKTYFGYKSTMQGVRKDQYTATNWTNMLKAEHNAGRPIIYAGFGDGGHCFVTDGYDNNNFFHFNWGWGGSYDGYFALNALNPGSGGIGGGSYSYNNGQQAVIGIEPSSGGGGGGGSTGYDLRLYAGLSMMSSFWFGSPISMTTNIGNFGTGGFAGDFGAAIFNSNGYFVDFMEVKSGMTLNPTSYFTYPLTFNKTGGPPFIPGTYYAALFYRTSTQDWTIVADGNYANITQFRVNYASSIEVNSAFTISNNGKLVQGSTATVNVDVLNTSSNTFWGSYRINLSDLNGNWVQNIQIQNETNGLPYNYHYTGGVNFSGTITAPPGTYLMEVAYQASGTSNWFYAGSSNYANPVYVIVEAPAIQADVYEPNDAHAQAYNLAVNFSGSNVTKTTAGSNLHVGTDIDYYKMALPPGYNYTVTARLHDKYSSGNGQSYSVDALFEYAVNGTSYSEGYDDVMPNNIRINNGSTLYFKVAPYFSGNTGTYLLEIKLTRTPVTGINITETDAGIAVYPNPARDFVRLELLDPTVHVDRIVICDMQGRQVAGHIATESGSITMPVSGLAEGTYLMKIFTKAGILTKKIVVKR